MTLRVVPPPDDPLTPEQRELVRAGEPFVEEHAAEIAWRYRGRVTRDELLGPGTIGLHEAAVKYREERHPSFKHYAKHYIRGRMLDAVRREHFSLRARVEHEMERAYSRMSGHQVLDVNLFSDPEEALREGGHRGAGDLLAAAFLAGVAEAEASTPTGEEELAEREECLVALEALREGIARLHPHEREVVDLYYVQGMTMDEVASSIRMSPDTAQRRHVAALRKLRKHLEAHGVTRAPTARDAPARARAP